MNLLMRSHGQEAKRSVNAFKSPFRRAFTLAVVIATLWGGPQATILADEGNRPNVLFIIADDLSAEALACYGNAQCQTPHIDDLAASGMRFTRAYCQFPVCGPSRAALMSGMYAQAVGVTGNGGSEQFTKILGDRPSMAELFKDNGYYSARVSKIYHMRVPGDITAGVDGPDHAASWTERFNCQAPEWMTDGENRMLTSEKLKWAPDEHYSLGFGTAFYVVRGSSDGAEQADIKAADKAIELLESHGDEPFFLAVGLVRPHVPLVAPAGYFDPYNVNEMLLPHRIEGDWDDIPKSGISANSRSFGLAGKLGNQRAVLEAYYACVSFMDAQVGRIVGALERLGLRDNTIVVFTSDHGYHLGEHDFWQKMSLHEESARIPLIFSVPDKSAGESSSLAQQIDIFPTLAELGGLPIPDHCQGKSLARAIDSPSEAVHDHVYCFRGNGHLIRTDRWAYMQYKDNSAELYDMQNDPQQFTNLANMTEHAATVREMRRLLRKKLDEIESASLVPAK